MTKINVTDSIATLHIDDMEDDVAAGMDEKVSADVAMMTWLVMWLLTWLVT
jgi:hypothetical protein